jgi:hypothetical protein
MRKLLSVTLALWISVGITYASEWPSATAVENLSTIELQSSLDNTPFDGWSALRSDRMDAPVMAMGAPITLPSSEAVAAIKSIANSGSEFRKIRRTTVKNIERVYLEELHDGLRVLSGRMDLVYGDQDRLSRWSLREHSQWPVPDHHLLSMNTAAQALASSVGFDVWNVQTERSFAAWYPDHELRVLRPVFWIRIEGEKPHERWEGVVDAVSGEIIIEWSGIQTDTVSGDVSGVYWQPYMHSEPQVAQHAFQSITINGNEVITEVDGSFSYETGATAEMVARLRGPYVSVENEDAPNGALPLNLQAPYEPTTLVWTEEYASAPELNLFYHTMYIKLWMAELDPEFTALDYPLPAVANVGDSYDNAYWNGWGTYYGSGAAYNNFAMYSDIIYHEYTHGVTDGIYPNGTLPYTGQSGALNEAWSDYIACTINGDPLMGEWLSGRPGGEFRNLENNLVFPNNWADQVHADSRFVSGALWRIRAQMGAEFTDDLAHFARYALAETFIDYLLAVLEIDDDDNNLTNGTPNGRVIYDSFGIHGIGPGDEPNFAIQNLEYYADGSGGSSGDGDRFVEPGEVVELNFVLKNDVQLFPPPATDVTVTISTEDAEIDIENGIWSVAVLGPAAEFDISGVQLTVNPNSRDHWGVINIRVTSNGGSIVFEQSLEFTIGTPQLLIVQDDASGDVERYVTGTVRDQDRIFDTIELAPNATLPDEYLPENGVILWLSGNAAGSVLTSEDQWKLRDYVNAGNKLILSGQYLARNLVGTVFSQNTLEVEIVEEPSLTRRVSTTGQPFGEDEWYMLAGTGGASNQEAMTVFNPIGGSRAVAYYGIGADNPAIIEFQDGKGLLMGFGIEAISDATHPGNLDRAAFMEYLYAWAGIQSSVPPTPTMTPTPLEWSLGPAYPNPFNPSTRIPYTIPTILNAEYRVVDIMGRTVSTGSLDQKVGSIHWQHDGPSGIYFLRVSWNGGSAPIQKLVLLK